MPIIKKISPFPVVGIGASAGGLEAFQELLKNLSDKPGLAIVFIMHLSRERKSLLVELLSKLTKIPVSEVKAGTIPKVDHIYIIPPGNYVSIINKKLTLKKIKGTTSRNLPIDHFFYSLAKEQKEKSIGVILSGTATDGTLGAEAIKAEEGIVFAQDLKTAKYDGMPLSAINSKCVDFVLSPKRIAIELERIAKHPAISDTGYFKPDESILLKDKNIKSIFALLLSAKGIDFTNYKSSTISRRLLRRMLLVNMRNTKHYLKFLRGNKGELEKLYEDLLINVTRFFRDPKVFDILSRSVIPAIINSKTKSQGIRIWVPGCSSGEEAYSIAIYLIEAIENINKFIPVHIFATDISEKSINKARRGIYDQIKKGDITPGRLKKFFTKADNSYRVAKQIREMCVFSKQNVFSDPPFSNIDLICCRNLLIYLQPSLQKKVFNKFHYALRPGGFLLLGSSESIGGYSNLFNTQNKEHKIFIKKYLSVSPGAELSRKYYMPKNPDIMKKTGTDKSKQTDIENMVDRISLSEYSPSGVLIDSNMEVLQFRGNTGRFIEPAAGKPNLNIFKLVREGLLLPLRAAISKAKKTKRIVKREAADVKYDGRKLRVKISIIPLKSRPLKEDLFLVLFDETLGNISPENPSKSGRKNFLDRKTVKNGEDINNLRKELAETKEYLQTVIEEQDGVSEEMKTANEEIMSSNEELQSTNEELETAKEELQSTNEELLTANEELQNRNIETVILNNDLINLLNSINMPMIMMDTHLIIRRITPNSEKTLNVISTDTGRPINKIKLNIDIPDFDKILINVMESLHSKTIEIKNEAGIWYSVHIRPYRTIDNKIDGVVAVFIDITKEKNAGAEIEHWASFTKLNPFPVFEIDLRGKILFINPSAEKWLHNISIHGHRYPLIQTILKAIKLAKTNKKDYIMTEFHLLEKWFSLGIYFTLGENSFARIYINDITERKNIEKKEKELVAVNTKIAFEQAKTTELEKAYNDLKEMQDKLIRSEKLAVLGKLAGTVSHELRNPLGVIKNSVYFLNMKLGRATRNEKIIKHLNILEKEIGIADKIVNDILSFSKIKEIQLSKTDINKILENLLKFVKIPQVINLITKLNKLPHISADEVQLKQVFYNIIINAAQAIPDKGEITISTRVKNKAIEIEIIDTGEGITKENLSEIFNPLFSTKAQGTGFGLTICKSIIEAHGGSIAVKSKPEKGSSFIIKLPIYNLKTGK